MTALPLIGPPELAAAVRAALRAAGLPDAEPAFERPRNREHGDWSTNVALALAKGAGAPPRQIAQRLVAALSRDGALPEGIAGVDIAGPGFVNFRLAQDALTAIVREAVTRGSAWGRTHAAPGSAGRANVEFVSANPTGPLHIGAGRWAAVGDALANLLEATGWDVTREYYFNDASEQMASFGRSVSALIHGRPVPEDGYRGHYVSQLADRLRAEATVDLEDLGAVSEAAYQAMLAHITGTLEAFGVRFDVYFGERTLQESGAIDHTIARLRDAGHVYTAEGATWLRTTAFGDDKDRVLLRGDGRPTYFAFDCAYLASKVARGFDKCLYLLGADHHGYVGRLQAIAAAEGVPAGTLEVVVGQLVHFYEAGHAVRMSKRTGEFVTFDDLLAEVGADAARYTILRTSIDVTLDFDFAQVVRAERDNPVYYVQYSHARIAGIMRQAAERGVHAGTVEDAPLDRLTEPAEVELVRRIGAYPETVARAAEERAPHKVARYAEDLAEGFHRFYTDCQVLSDDYAVTSARYWLCVAARQTLVNALGLLGVSGPDRM